MKTLLLPTLCASLACAQAATQPNIVFVMVDDLGIGDVGCYGQTNFTTPYLDLMAAEGIRFTQAYSGSTVCAPARSTLMTGLHAGHTSVRFNTGGVPLLASDVTIAEVLQQAGYATGGFGKWGLGDLDTEGAPEKQGFDRFFGYYHQIHAHSYYPDYLIDTGKKVPLPGNTGFYTNNKEQGGMPAENNGMPAEYSHYRIKKEMFDWIRAQKDGPFFCYATWTPPHTRAEIPETDPGWQAVKDKSWDIEAKVHAAFTKMIDHDMGGLFQLLKNLGIEKNTVVMFCSDNGSDDRYEDQLNSSGPFRGHKRSLYEGGIRVPFIVRWPGQIPPARASNLSVWFPDVAPTLAQLGSASQYLPLDIDGLSFAPTLLNKGYQVRHPYLYWEYTPMNWNEGGKPEPEKTAQAARIGNWKAVRETLSTPIELYDLSTDPAEERNVNVAEDHKELIKKFTALFETVRTEPRPQPEPAKPEGKSFR